MLSFFSIDKYPGVCHTPIVIWGAGKVGMQIITMYEVEYMDYNITAIVDNNMKMHGVEITPSAFKNIDKDAVYCHRKIPVISVEKMREYCREHADCIIVVASIVEQSKNEIHSQISELHLENPVIDEEEFRHLVVREYIDCHIKKYDLKLAYQYYTFYYDFVNHVYVDKFRPIIGALDKNIPFVTIVSPPKTGGNTVDDALTEAGVPHLYYHNGYNLNENPEQPDRWVPIIKQRGKKFVIGVREPISQNISLMFNQMPNFFSFRKGINNLDAQQLFASYVEDPILGKATGDSIYEYELMKTGTNFIRELYVQHYFEGSIKTTLGIDVYQIDFDQEAGYTIAEQEGKHIFIYQIEKMDFVKQQLADFLDVEPVHFGHSNDGAKKYYNNPYKKFVKEFKMSREYFDYSYSCDCVRHFYSNKSIEEYMTKWRGHII